MKKMIGTKEVEDIRTFCDGCEVEIGSGTNTDHSLNMDFFYGYYSHRDGDNIDLDFCDECANKIEELVRKAFPNIRQTENEWEIQEHLIGN